MIAEGLLWFDDDPRRPLSAKVAEAGRRFSERTGWAPTACEVNPQTLALRSASATQRAARSPRARAAKELEDKELDGLRLRITPNPSLRPNYFLVGVEAGKTPRPARRERPARKPAAPKRPRSAPATRISA